MGWCRAWGGKGPGHGYTRALIAAAPEVPEGRAPQVGGVQDPIFWARNLNKTYAMRRKGFAAPPERLALCQPFQAELGFKVMVVGANLRAVVFNRDP